MGTHHIHVVDLDGQQWDAYLLLREHLRQSERAREAYSAEKRALAARHPADRRAYTKAKDEIVARLLRGGTPPNKARRLTSQSVLLPPRGSVWHQTRPVLRGQAVCFGSQLIAEPSGGTDRRGPWMAATSSSVWAVIALLAIACHFVLFALLHWLEPQLSPKVSIISDYGETGSAWIGSLAFLAFASVWLALSFALPTALPDNWLLGAGRMLFALSAISIVAGAFLPESMDPRTAGPLAKIINLAARPGLFLAIVLVSAGLRRIPEWRDLSTLLLSLSIVAAALLPLTVAVLLDRGFGGVGQRAIFGLVYAWVLIVSVRLIAVGGRT